jgi:two-component system cell cycle sensor histidine kinase/response regulator CckA
MTGCEARWAPMSVRSQSGNGTILLAEDEALLRELGQTILTQAGYNVLTIYRREEVMSLLESRSDPIDILLTDVVMPEISSRELITLVQARWPGIRVIYMSGYSSDDLTDIDHNAAFLQKPFTPAELMTKIRQVMGR